MKLSGRKFAITGAGRGLGAALAICLAKEGATPVLLGRNEQNLINVSNRVRPYTEKDVNYFLCDLAIAGDCIIAANYLSEKHSDIDGLIHNGAMWLSGAIEQATDEDIQTCIASAATGAIILTKHLLPMLKMKPHVDIHTVVSTSGIPNRPLSAASIAFRAAKSAQDGFTQGLAEETKHTNIRVTSVYPCDFDDIKPDSPEWNKPRTSNDPLTNREVVETILYLITRPANARIHSVVLDNQL